MSRGEGVYRNNQHVVAKNRNNKSQRGKKKKEKTYPYRSPGEKAVRDDRNT